MISLQSVSSYVYVNVCMHMLLCVNFSLLFLLSHSFATPCNPSGSSVHGIFQARILERLAISFSRRSSQRRDWKCITCLASTFFPTEPPGKALNFTLTSLLKNTFLKNKSINFSELQIEKIILRKLMSCNLFYFYVSKNKAHL